jgi:phosphoribosylpyrophosphate synthetase
MFQNFSIIVCGKERNGEERIVRINEGDPTGKHCIVVDDLIQTGGTIIKCQRVLKAKGAIKASAYATHAVFPEESWKKFTERNLFTKVWVTNTCSEMAEILKNQSPFKILDIYHLLRDIVRE